MFLIFHNLCPKLDEPDLAAGHMAQSMIENHTALTGFHYRYGYHMQVPILYYRVGYSRYRDPVIENSTHWFPLQIRLPHAGTYTVL